MYMHHMCRCICGWVLTKWNHQTPSLQNGLLETHGYFPGASNWNTSGTKLENNWNTTGTPTPKMEHNWYMHHKWRLHWRMSSYKMEPPDHQSTEWIAGNSRLFSRSLQLEHKWNKTRIRRQLEHKWNTHPRNGTQLEHKWDTTGTCITSDDAICGLLWDIHLVTGFHACLLFVLLEVSHLIQEFRNGPLFQWNLITRVSVYFCQLPPKQTEAKNHQNYTHMK